MTILRSFHIPCECGGPLTITESQHPNEVEISIEVGGGCASVTLTEQAFRALCRLGEHSHSYDYVRFSPAPSE